ncbi:MAG: hypothetical protein ACOH5I_10855 [Oligoflexus sp.]
MKTLGLLIVAMIIGGCMTSPYDQQVFQTTEQAIPFKGYARKEESLQIQALNPITNNFEEIGKAKAASKKTVTTDDRIDLYFWSTKTLATKKTHQSLSCIVISSIFAANRICFFAQIAPSFSIKLS